MMRDGLSGKSELRCRIRILAWQKELRQNGPVLSLENPCTAGTSCGKISYVAFSRDSIGLDRAVANKISPSKCASFGAVLGRA
jgi:hypothetical protein